MVKLLVPVGVLMVALPFVESITKFATGFAAGVVAVYGTQAVRKIKRGPDGLP